VPQSEQLRVEPTAGRRLLVRSAPRPLRPRSFTGVGASTRRVLRGLNLQHPTDAARARAAAGAGAATNEV
jgi:hypothetical protein